MKPFSHDYNRRQFIRDAGIASSLLVFNPSIGCANNTETIDDDLSYSIFSKHLQFLNYEDMADAAANLGFDGIDLTVRKKGHVEPERVEDELPPAIAAIKKAGLNHDMMASDVKNAEEDVHRRVLKTAASLGVKYYRMGYLRFLDEQSIPDRLTDLNGEMKTLAALNRELGITGGYQNHSGKHVGAQLWDLWHLLKDINPEELGCQFDIRHSVVEGGRSWENSLKLIEPQINSIVLKDFIWAKDTDGKWQIKNVPLGEGMVDFTSYFKLLKQMNIRVPATIHYEYDLGGVEHGARELHDMKAADIFKMMKKDLDFAKAKWREA